MQQRASDLGESAARATYLSLRIDPSFRISPLKVAATLLNGSGKGAVGA